MKKFLSILLAFVICLTSAVGVLAAAPEFVPSISYKGSPDIVPVEDEDGNKWLGTITDASGNILAYIGEDCLVVTSVADAKTSTAIPDHAEEMLLKVYDALNDGSMTIPYEKVSADIDPSKMVIRDLFDATWLCEDHPEMLEPEGVVFNITFDLGVKATTDVIVMTYKNDEWNPIVKAVNNGDGSVTCTFENLCPISFSVMESSYNDSVKTGDDTNMAMWGVLMAVAAAGLVVVFTVRRKSAR